MRVQSKTADFHARRFFACRVLDFKASHVYIRRRPTMVLNPVISKLAGKRVVLASASPRRLEILTNAGLKFEVVPSWFRETLDKTLFETPHEYAVETAKQKALEVAKRMPYKHLKTPDIVIGADTVVSVDGLILEKPVDKQDAYRMLSRLSGKEHSVFTGVAIILCQEREGGEIEHCAVDFFEETKVKFSDLSEEMLWEYIHSGEPMDKAGGYGIQALGGMLVEYVRGDFLNVVGFPLNHFCKRLGELFNQGSPGPPAERDEAQRTAVEESPSKCAENGTSGTAVPASASGGAVRSGPDGFPRRIVDLMDGFRASKALFAASKLKVFDLLTSEDGLSAVEVAGGIAAAVESTERLLDALVSLGLLTKIKRRDTAAYRNTEQTNRYLVSSSEVSLHDFVLHLNDQVWPVIAHLEHAVQEGTNQHERAFGGKRSGDPSQEPATGVGEKKLRFMKAMHAVAKVTGRDVAAAFDLSRFKTACDLGGCTGAMAYELTGANPGLSVTVFDLQAVVEMSSHFCPDHLQDSSSRVTFLPGDFFKDELPKADLYILARILHDWSDEKVNFLLSKLSAICTPGCGLLVAEMFVDEDGSGPSRPLLQALSMTAGRQRSAEEYRLLMKKHGFAQESLSFTHSFLDAILCIKE